MKPNANMNGMLKAAVDAIHRAEQGSTLYDMAAFTLWGFLSNLQRTALKILIEEGPIHDGNIPSKSARDDLIAYGLVSRACVKGEQGYAVANYIGWDVYRIGMSESRS